MFFDRSGISKTAGELAIAAIIKDSPTTRHTFCKKLDSLSKQHAARRRRLIKIRSVRFKGG
jgi:hypothetical protein